MLNIITMIYYMELVTQIKIDLASIRLLVYLFHRDDAKKVGGVGADVKGVPSISIDDAVLHLSVDPDVPVLRPDATHR